MDDLVGSCRLVLVIIGYGFCYNLLPYNVDNFLSAVLEVKLNKELMPVPGRCRIKQRTRTVE